MTLALFRAPFRASPLLAASALPLLASAVLAQDTAPIVLDPVVLTAGFSPVEADAYGRAATVVTAEELRQKGAANVQDALRGLPGVSVIGSGSSNTAVRLRGGETRHTLVLIDGINAAAGDQPYLLSGLELDDVERIEVLRGPQSVYYGSAAASGVVNIITRKADATGGFARAEIGNGAAGAISHAVVADRWRLQGTLAYREDNGFDASAGDGGDDDGIRRATLGLSGEWEATESLRLGFSHRKSEERYWYDEVDYAATSADDYLVDAPFWADRAEHVDLLWGEMDALDGRLATRLSWQDTLNELSAHDAFPRETQARRRAVRLRTTYGLDGRVAEADQTLALSVERTDDDASGSGVTRRWQTDSVALEYRGAFDNGLDVQLGLRHDDNSAFRDKTTWAAGLSWRIGDSGFRLHGSAGTGIANPQYFQMLGGFGYVGNPDLTPEENRSVDLGVEYSLPDGRGLIDVTWFRERLENAIEFSSLPLPDGTNYYNMDGTSRREGVEIAGRHDLTDNLTLGVAYTYLDARNPDDSAAVRRPRHELGLNATLRTFGGRGWVSADLRHVADLPDTQYWGAFETRRLPDFTTVNLAASYDLTDTARLSGRVTNLFDAEYSETWGYATQGRAAWIGVESRW